MTLRKISKFLLAGSLALIFAGPAGAQDDAQAQIFQFFMKRAESGDASAQFIVAERYAQGKGAPQSSADAQKWYAEAAKNGHPMAQQKMQELAAEEKKALSKTVAAPTAAPVAAVPIAPPAPKPVPVAPRPVAQAKVVPTAPTAKSSPDAGKNGASSKGDSAKAPEAASSLDTAAILLAGKWQKSGRAAEALPSDANSCLRTGEREIVCFSDELSRAVDGKKLTYIVKSTLTDFANDGRFVVRYVYNVTDISSGGGNTDDAADLLPKSGWQEPGHVLDCRAADAKSISCLRDKKQEVRFSR